LGHLEIWKQIADTDVWKFSLDCDDIVIGDLRSVLSSDEIRRANRFVTEQLQTRFIVGRATIRIVLSTYLGDTEPANIEFIYGSHEKPSIPNSDLRFNLSHSHGLALLAVSRNDDVGIDLEWLDRQVEIEEIAERFFTPEECAEMMGRVGANRTARFFDLWCCKEAYLKAVGVGISGGLNKCRIIDAPDGTASVHNPTDPQAIVRWKIYRLEPETGFAGALCIEVCNYLVTRLSS
jgi:4'-phosphopantetheinyl transferase